MGHTCTKRTPDTSRGLDAGPATLGMTAAPAQVAKTLTLRVVEDAIIVVTWGDSRLDKRKVQGGVPLRKGRCSMSTLSLQMRRALFVAPILAGALAGSAMAQAPDGSCALPSEPEGIPAALDAAITGPADKDRACMKALLVPEA